MEIKFYWPETAAPITEYNHEFIQGMLNRMAQSFGKYGLMRAATDIDHLKSSAMRVDRYRADGNTEWLLDGANELMIEFTIPSHPNAHFRATRHAESPGLPTKDGEHIQEREREPIRPKNLRVREGD